MRIRQIKPEFFKDRLIASLPFRTRLVYEGLWCLADDAGWFLCSPDEIALELFPWDGVKVRERWVCEDLTLLQEKGEIEVAPCGHGFIPTLTIHQRFSGQTKRVYTFQRAHEARCLSGTPADTRGDPRTPAEARPGIGIGKGTEQELGTDRNGKVEALDARNETEFQRLVPRPVALGRA